jgi:signal transduction histidine kinase/ligand-binding sensor domain-containing protein
VRNAFAGLALRILVAGFVFLPACASLAVETSATWLYRPWESDDGLPDNNVTGVAQTPDGYLWVGTAGGLMRFDGARFQEFPLANLDGVPNRVVRALVQDRSGQVWLGMDRGPVVCVAPGGAQALTNQLPDARAISMAEDGDGAIWVAYANGGVSRIHGKEVKLFGGREGVPGGGSGCLASDSAGQLWFSKNGHVGLFRNGKFETRLSLQETAMRVCKARRGGIWICAGLKLMTFGEGSTPVERGSLPRGLEEITPSALLEDSSGALWIGTTASGLFRLAPPAPGPTKDQPANPSSVLAERVPTSYPEITCLTEDHEGNIWAGTSGGGLNRLRPRAIELIGAESGIPFESVRSLAEDPSGAIWATTPNGLLARWQKASWTTMSKDTNWPGGRAACVATDRDGALWIGTQNRGLYRLQPCPPAEASSIQASNFSVWRRAQGLASDAIRSVLPSSQGDVWIGTDSPTRLQCLHQGQLRNFPVPPHTRTIRAMAEDVNSNIWIGTAEGQLLRVHGEQVINETHRISTRPLSIRCLYATPDGAVWIGFAGWGLGRLKGDQYDRLTSEQGLNDDYVSQILADGRGWLWLAGNRGLFQVKIEDVMDVAENQSQHLRSIVYGRGEGLPNLQPNYENFPGALRGHDGRLWFPMRTGLAVIHAERIGHNPEPPPVMLERVAVDGLTVMEDGRWKKYQKRKGETASKNLVAENGAPGSITDPSPRVRVKLLPSHRKLDFEFTALSFTAPENVHFQYRLKPFEEDWVEAGTVRKATYPRLSAGDYLFQVKACNNAGVWNETGASIAFVVEPFFWQAWWFRGSMLGAFTLSLIGVVRYVSFRRLRLQLRQLEQQAALHKERARIAKDIHDDLGANLTQISLLSELTRQDMASPEKAVEHLFKISGTARQVIKSLDEIVWAVNPRNDTLAHLIDYAGQFAVDYARLAGLRCRLDLPEETPVRELSTDVRHNLFLAIKEALHNVVKHAQATELWLRISATPQHLAILVEDNGCGFQPPPPPRTPPSPVDDAGDGLWNMRQRMSEIGGECQIESQVGRGTKVSFELPWPR